MDKFYDILTKLGIIGGLWFLISKLIEMYIAYWRWAA